MLDLRVLVYGEPGVGEEARPRVEDDQRGLELVEHVVEVAAVALAEREAGERQTMSPKIGSQQQGRKT